MSQSKIYSLDMAHTACVCSLSFDFFWREYLFFEVTGRYLVEVVKWLVRNQLRSEETAKICDYNIPGKKRRLCN